MAIEDLIPTRFMNTSRQQEADIEQSQSASRLNNVQSHRILSLLPGEMEQQALSSAGMNLDNIIKRYQIEGQQINNRIGVLGERKAQLDNMMLEVEAANAEVNMELKQKAQQQEIALTKARIAEAAAITKLNMSKLDLERQKLYQQQIYPQVAAKFSTIGKLAKGGDLAGANSLYQSLIKQLPPDFLRFEGKGGMDLLGPEIDPKDLEPLPGAGGMSLLDVFTEHARMLVPADSLQGQSMLQAQQDSAAMERTRVTAAAAPSNAAGLKNDKTELEITDKVYNELAPKIIQGVVGGTVNKRQIFNEKGEIAKPAVAYAMNKLTKLAVQTKKDTGKDISDNLSKLMTVYSNWMGEPYVMPKNETHREYFKTIMKRVAEAQNFSEEEAYQFTFDQYISNETVLRSIFE